MSLDSAVRLDEADEPLEGGAQFLHAPEVVVLEQHVVPALDVPPRLQFCFASGPQPEVCEYVRKAVKTKKQRELVPDDARAEHMDLDLGCRQVQLFLK